MTLTEITVRIYNKCSKWEVSAKKLSSWQGNEMKCLTDISCVNKQGELGYVEKF